MAFLFKSKKNADKAQATRDVAGSQASMNSGSTPRANEKGAVQASTPASSVNNSITSLQGAGNATPSPEQAGGRRGPNLTSEPLSDLPVSNLDRATIENLCATTFATHD